jgi:hypothetical protein
VTALDFLSPSRCEAGTTTSPLRRALDGATGVEDRSLDGKVELRGDVDGVSTLDDEELVRLSPRRGFVFTPHDPAEAVERFRAQGVLAYDATGGWAGVALDGERLMRRLTDLDLDALPAAGACARVPAIVLRDGGERFRVYVPQELGHDVAIAVLDALDGLANTGARHASPLRPGVGAGHARPGGTNA